MGEVSGGGTQQCQIPLSSPWRRGRGRQAGAKSASLRKRDEAGEVGRGRDHCLPQAMQPRQVQARVFPKLLTHWDSTICC